MAEIACLICAVKLYIIILFVHVFLCLLIVYNCEDETYNIG